MTPKEFQQALIAFKREFAPKADVFASINDSISAASAPALHVSFYPHGLAKSENYFRVEADDFAPLLDLLKAEWTKKNELIHAETVRRMALEIIRVTEETGVCTDAALRCKFDADEVKRLGAEACAKANDMAARGPFEIVAVAPNSNAGTAQAAGQVLQ